MRTVASVLRRRHDHRRCAVGLQAAVQQTHGLGDEPGVEVVVDGVGIAHDGGGIATGVVPLAYGDGAKLLRSGPEDVHVATRQQADLLHRRDESEGDVVLAHAAHFHRLLFPGPTSSVGAAGTSSRLFASITGAVGDDVVGLARGHGHGGELDAVGARAASHRRGGEEVQLWNAEGVGNI